MLYNKEKSKETKRFISENKNWFAVGILSIIVMGLVPLLGSYVSGKTSLPKDWLEWMIYITCSLATSICCIMIWLCLHNQGKLNVQDDENYIKAKELHLKNFLEKTGKKIAPINPFEWEKKAKIKKGICQFFGVFTGLLGLGLGALTYNFNLLVSGLTALGMCIGFGLYHMAEVEKVFTEDFLEYELFVEQELLEEKKRKELEENFFNESENIIKEDNNGIN